MACSHSEASLSLSCFWLSKGSPSALLSFFHPPLPFTFFLSLIFTAEALSCSTEGYSESSSTAPSQPPLALCAAAPQPGPEREKGELCELRRLKWPNSCRHGAGDGPPHMWGSQLVTTSPGFMLHILRVTSLSMLALSNLAGNNGRYQDANNL